MFQRQTKPYMLKTGKRKGGKKEDVTYEAWRRQQVSTIEARQEYQILKHSKEASVREFIPTFESLYADFHRKKGSETIPTIVAAGTLPC